ncbi:hypothetical protein RRG08_020324 [Elysia crispata]|uniref:Fibrinogen C-terminal domain-containing protein n=1 Tax=Elysia crispata TaxID=231223 RepID=A0AAE0YCK8_9GAST|nr:hypothetical protein RRG08_020324 [Elysia crispata]
MARNLCVITALLLFVFCHGLDLMNINSEDLLPDSEETEDEESSVLAIKLFFILQQYFTQSVNKLEESMELKLMSLERKTKQMHTDMINKHDLLHKKMEDRFRDMQKECNCRTIDVKKKLPICERNMNYKRAKTYPAYILTFYSPINKEILCNTHTDKGGWIIIQRRTNGKANFKRTWEEYKNGFGDFHNFWLGNEALHQLTVTDRYEIRIVMRKKNRSVYARYASFRVEAESDNYRLKLGKYIGNHQKPGYGLSYHNNQQFYTRDRDIEAGRRKCFSVNHGGWWHEKFRRANLNGLWGVQTKDGMYWNTGPMHQRSLEDIGDRVSL